MPDPKKVNQTSRNEMIDLLIERIWPRFNRLAESILAPKAKPLTEECLNDFRKHCEELSVPFLCKIARVMRSPERFRFAVYESLYYLNQTVMLTWFVRPNESVMKEAWGLIPMFAEHETNRIIEIAPFLESPYSLYARCLFSFVDRCRDRACGLIYLSDITDFGVEPSALIRSISLASDLSPVTNEKVQALHDIDAVSRQLTSVYCAVIGGEDESLKKSKSEHTAGTVDSMPMGNAPSPAMDKQPPNKKHFRAVLDQNSSQLIVNDKPMKQYLSKNEQVLILTAAQECVEFGISGKVHETQDLHGADATPLSIFRGLQRKWKTGELPFDPNCILKRNKGIYFVGEIRKHPQVRRAKISAETAESYGLSSSGESRSSILDTIIERERSDRPGI